MKNIFHYIVILCLLASLTLTAQITPNIQQFPVYQCLSDNGTSGEPECFHACTGDTIKYTTPVSGTGYQWSVLTFGPQPNIIGGATNDTFCVVFTAAGNYKIRLVVFSSGGAVQLFETCVNVVDGVTAQLAANYPVSDGCISICKNTTVTFFNNSFPGIVTSTWDFGDNTNTVTQGTATVTHTYTQAGTYLVTLLVQNECCKDTATLCVIVDENEGPDIFCVSQICVDDDNVQYCTNATCSSYQWSIIPAAAGTISSGAGTNCITVNWANTLTGSVSLLCTGPNTCPVPTIVSIPIMPNGSFSISGPNTVCVGSSATYSAPYVTGSQLTWTLTEPCFNTTTVLPYNTPPYQQTISFPCAGTYVLICHMVNDVLDCTGADTITITALPDFSISGPDTVCVNSPATFNALQNSTPFNCDWSTLPATSTVNNSPTATFTFTTPGNYTVTAVPAVPNSACSPAKSKTVVVLPAPPAPQINGPTVLCPNTPYNFSASGSGSGVSYSWTATGGVSVAPATGDNVVVTLTGSGTLSVSATSAANCAGPATTINLNPPAPPSPGITGPVSACPDDQLSYSATLSYSPNSTVQWLISPAAAGTILSGQGTNSVTIKWHAAVPNAQQTATVTVTETICGNVSGSASLNVTINKLPSPTVPSISACIGQNVSVTASGGAGSAFSWFQADGTSLGSGNPFSLPGPGNYYTTETDAKGCKANAYFQVVALPQPVVQIFGPLSAPCNETTGNFSQPVQLQTFNGTGYSFLWSNGSTSDVTTVTTPGTYTVTVTGPNGCTKSATHTVVCACPSSPCPQCVNGGPCDNNGNLINAVTLSAPTGGTAYQWSDGATTSSISVNTPGTYTVTVTNSNNQACPNSSFSFYVHCESDNCPFSSSGSTCTANAPTVNQGSNCNQFSFTANTDCIGTPSWSFGDSQGASGSTVNHTYTQAGIYTVCYQIPGNGLCQPPAQACTTVTVPVAADFSYVINCSTVNFTQLATVLSPDFITSYSWQFGDPSNSTSSIPNPSFTYPSGGLYTVTLTVTTHSGCTAVVSQQITIASPVVTASIASTACNQPVNFSASASSNVPIVAWQWNFGDNQGSSIQNPQHTYTVASCTTFNVSVTATDGNGCSATTSAPVQVCPPPPPFNLTYTSPGCGNVSMDAGQGYATYQWLLNGNPISGATNQTYLATTSGTYTCQVTDANQCLITSNPATVVVNPLPALNPSVSPMPVCDNTPLTLSAGLSAAGVTIDWFDVNNINVGTGPTLPLGLLPAGSYTYYVVATDQSTNCTATDSITFAVNPAPTVTVSNSHPSGICAPAIVTVTATANPANVTYLWNTGATSQAINVAAGGIYTVTVTDALGCSASASNLVTIFPLPDLSMLPIGCASGCLPDTIHGPPNLATYDWQINNTTVSTAQDLILTPALMPVLNVPYIITLIATTNQGCADTASFEYTPKPCPDSVKCFTITDSLVCNGNGTYSLQLNVFNNHASASASIYLHGFTPGFTINGLPYYVQFLYVPPGNSSGWFPVPPLTLNPGTSSADSFCFKALIIFADTCCCDSICIPLPDCNPCENVGVLATPVVSSSQNLGCCAQVDITNNFIPNYFTGVQVVPVTPGASIGSVSLGSGGTGWFTSGTSAQMSFYPPSGFIPTGTITDLFTLCLNLQVNTPAPQMVLFHWLSNSSTNQDSIVCTDTLFFDCDAPQPNPCGEIEDTIVCVEPGVYLYTFTLTNNSPYPVHTAIIDYLNPLSIGLPIIYFFNPALQPGQTSAPVSVTINTSLPPGSQVCYHMTLLDTIGCCCLTMDTVCFTIPDCPDSLCACGDWNNWQITAMGGEQIVTDTIPCGQLLNYSSGTTISLAPAGNPCQGTCQPSVQWELFFGNTLIATGSGYPSVTLTTQGVYTLNLYGSCDSLICDTCVFDIIVTDDPACVCVGWEGPLYVHVGSDFYSLNNCNVTLDGTLGETIQVSGFFLCNDPSGTCLAEYDWQVTDAAATIIASGSGLPVFFNPPLPGLYTLSLMPKCGTTVCDTCNLHFFITLPVDSCTCGYWGDFVVTTSEASYIYQSCGAKYWSETKFPITLSGSYYCLGGSCKALLSWVIKRNGFFYASGTGMPIQFMPTIAGNYSVVIVATCGLEVCAKCRFSFKVTDGFAPELPDDELQDDLSLTVFGSPVLKLEPNPANDNVRVSMQSDSEESGRLLITNELGIPVMHLSVNLKKGNNEWLLPLAHLAGGWYVVHFTGQNNRVCQQLIITR